MNTDTETWALDELERVMGGDVVLSPRAEYEGGEWDYLKSIPLAWKRRLIGGRYLTTRGFAPDIAAGWIIDRVAGIETTDDAMRWYVTTCRTAIEETRVLAEKRRYAARVKKARDAGQDSYHYHRLARTAGIG